MIFSEQTRLAAKEIVARYPRARSALLPMLHLVQAEEGYVSPEGIRFCADELGLTKAEVAAVATFYTMYKRRPTGEYLVSVCTNTLCDVLGGDEIYRSLSERLGVGHDETTADGRITLEHAECLAACDYAPVVTVNYEFFDQQSPASALELVGELQDGRRPMPTRGAPLCTFREISLQLAGLPDERPDALDAGPAGEPTLVGSRLAVRRGETAPPYDQPAPLDESHSTDEAAPAAPTPPAAAAAPASPAVAPQTAAERSAAQGEADYGGEPGAGTSAHDAPQQTAASDPASSPGSGVGHEEDAAETGGTDLDVASGPGADRPAADVPGPGAGSEGAVPGAGTEGAGPGAGTEGAGPEAGSEGEPGPADRPRARKTPRKEG